MIIGTYTRGNHDLIHQKASCRKRAQELGANEIREYYDAGISGLTLERPGLMSLRKDISEGLIDVLIVFNKDRLSRELCNQQALIKEFEESGVRLVFIDYLEPDQEFKNQFMSFAKKMGRG